MKLRATHLGKHQCPISHTHATRNLYNDGIQCFLERRIRARIFHIAYQLIIEMRLERGTKFGVSNNVKKKICHRHHVDAMALLKNHRQNEGERNLVSKERFRHSKWSSRQINRSNTLDIPLRHRKPIVNIPYDVIIRSKVK